MLISMKSELRWLVGGGMTGLAVLALILCAVQYHRERLATLHTLQSLMADRVVALEAHLVAATAPVTALRQAIEAGTSPPDVAVLTSALARWGAGLENVGATLTRLSVITSAPGPEETPVAANGCTTAALWSALQPANDPTGQPGWSRVTHDSRDASGADGSRDRHLVAGYGEPIYRGNRFLGIAAGEVTLDFMARIVELPTTSNHRLVLIDLTRHVLADSTFGPTHARTPTLALGEMLPAMYLPDSVTRGGLVTPEGLAARGYTVIVTPVTRAPWLLVCLLPEGALFLQVAPWLLLGLAMVGALFVMLTVAHRLFSRHFVAPALTLVRLIGAEINGDVLPPQRIPARWRPWVSRIVGAFAKHRAELARADHQIADLTDRLDAQAEALRQINAAGARHETAHRQCAAALAAEQALVDGLLESAPGLVLVVDDAGRIVRCNRTCTLVSGLDATAIRGQRLWEFLVPPEEADLVRVRVATVLRGDGPLSGPGHWLTPSGERYTIQWTLSAVEKSTAPLIAFGQIPAPQMRADKG